MTARAARINVKLLVILVLTVLILGGGAVGLHFLRKRWSANAALAAGQTAAEQSDWEEASRRLKVYLAQYPDDEQVLREYADVTLRIQPQKVEHLLLAISAYRRLHRFYPGDRDLCATLVDLYGELGDQTEIEYFCSARLQVAPDDARAAFQLANAQALLLKNDKARATLEGLIAAYPRETQPYATLAKILMLDETDVGREAAGQLLDRCVEVNPKSASAYVQRAFYRRSVLGDAEAARADLAMAKEFAWSGDVALMVADEWRAMGELDKARQALEVAMREPPAQSAIGAIDDADFRLARFLVQRRVLLASGSTAGAATLAREIREVLPDKERLTYLPDVVDLFLIAGEDREAATAIDTYTAELDARNLRGTAVFAEKLILMEAGLATVRNQPYDVIALLEQALGTRFNAVQGWHMLWRAYEATGQQRRLIASMEDYLTRFPADAEAKLQLSRLHREADPSRARELAIAGEAVRRTFQATLQRIETEIALNASSDRHSANLANELAVLAKTNPAEYRVYVLQADLAVRRGQLPLALEHLRAAGAHCPPAVELTVLEAEVLRRMGDVAAAEQTLERAISEQPKDAGLRMAMARLLLNTDRPAEAERWLDEAAAIVSPEQRHEVQYFRIAARLSAGDRAAAVDMLQAQRRADPQDVRCRLALLDMGGDLDPAISSQTLVDELKGIEGPRGLRWRAKQAQVWLDSPNWAAHEAQIRELLADCRQRDPMWAEPVLLLGGLHEMRREDHLAERAYKDYIEANPRRVDVVGRLLKLLGRKQRYAEAAALMDRLPAGEASFGLERASVAVGLGDYRGAIDLLEQSIAADPGAAEPRVMLARIRYLRSHDTDGALRLLDEAAAADPQLIAVLAARVHILMREGRGEEANRLVDAAVEQRGDLDAYALRAAHRAVSGQTGLAEQDYQAMAALESDSGRAHLLWGLFLYRERRRDEALAVWRKGLARFSDDEDLARMLIPALLESSGPSAERDRAEARQRLEAVLARHPGDPQLIFFEALAVPADDFDQRIDRLRHVVSLDPSYVQANQVLINMLRARGDLPGASSQVIQALGANPRNLELMLLRCEIEFQMNRRGMAREYAEDVLERSPDNLRAHMVMAQLAAEAGDPVAADRHLAVALEQEPDDEQVRVLQARVLLSRGETAAARQALATYADSPVGADAVDAQLLLADMLCAAGEHAAAAPFLKRLETLAPEDPRRVAVEIRYRAATGRLDTIEHLLPARGSATARDLPTLFVAAKAWEQAGQPDRAVEAYERGLEVNDTWIAGVVGMAQVAHRREDLENAELLFRRALDLDAYQQQALNDLAWLLGVQQQRGEEALRLAVRGVERYPTNPHLLDTRGMLYLRSARLAEARKDFERGLDHALGGTRVSCLLHLAEVEIQDGRMDVAEERLRQAEAAADEVGQLDSRAAELRALRARLTQ